MTIWNSKLGKTNLQWMLVSERKNIFNPTFTDFICEYLHKEAFYHECNCENCDNKMQPKCCEQTWIELRVKARLVEILPLEAEITLHPSIHKDIAFPKNVEQLNYCCTLKTECKPPQKVISKW